MKKKSISQCAFFNLRVFIGASVVLAAAFLALIGVGTFSGLSASSAQAQQNHKIIYVDGFSPGFGTATIHERGIDRQENLLAGTIMIACGEAEGGSGAPYGAFSQLLNSLTAPLAYGGADVDLVTGADSITHPTQSETYKPWPTPIIPTRLSSRTTIPGRLPPTIPAHRSPATAAPPSPASTQALSQVDTGRTLAIRLLSTTNLAAVSLQFFWLLAAADRASAPGSPLTVVSPGRSAHALPTLPLAMETASLAGPITIHRLLFTGGCTFPSTTSLLASALSKLPFPLITAPPGTPR